MFEHLIAYVRETPWAIQPAVLQVIIEVLTMRATGERFDTEEMLARIGGIEALNKPAKAVTRQGVAVLGLRGILSHRIEQVNNVSGPGGTSVEGFRQRLRQAIATPEVGAVVIDVDSPGGAVDGIPELAADVRTLRGQKPILAVANTQAASAAFWLAAQADELFVSPSGQVGSVGVFTAHVDRTGFEEKTGHKTTLISAGRFKVEGHPFGPLSEEAAAYLQHRVDSMHGKFVADLATGRGVSEDQVRTGFGEGRTFNAEDAMAAGMVDGIATLEETISIAQSRIAAPAPSRGRAQSLALRHGLAEQGVDVG